MATPNPTLDAARKRLAQRSKPASTNTNGKGLAAEKVPEKGQELMDAATGQVLGKPTIPSDYAAMGVSYGFSPPPPAALTMVITGLSGVGKTTFVSSIPKALVVSFRPHGAKGVIGARAANVYLRSWADWDRLRTKLIADGPNPSRPYDTVVFDTSDEWFNPLAEKIIADWNERASKPVTSIGDVGQKGKGFSEVGALLMQELRAIQTAGYGWIATGHLIEKSLEINGMMTTKLRVVLAPSCYGQLVQAAFIKAQIIPFMETTKQVTRKLPDGRSVKRTVAIPEAERVFEYRLTIRAGDADFDAKTNLPDLPPYVAVPVRNGWDAFATAYQAAVERGQQLQNQILSGNVSE